MVENLLKKLHKQYRFPEQFRNLERNKNPVNKLALTKMSNALSSWKALVKNSSDKGESWEVISKKNPMLDEEEFKIFKADIATADAIHWTNWGKTMREQNIGNHRLGRGGYSGNRPFGTRRTPGLNALVKTTLGLKSRTCSLGNLFGPATTWTRKQGSSSPTIRGEGIREESGKEFIADLKSIAF